MSSVRHHLAGSAPWALLASLALMGASLEPLCAQYTNWTPYYDEWRNMKPVEPRGYVSYRVAEAIVVDGNLEEPGWQALPWTEFFVDIEGDVKPRPYYRTQAKIGWDDTYLYIAGDLEEHHVRGSITEHDAVMYMDNNFEIFIDPDSDNHHYYELEINTLNSVWDLMLHTPYRDGGERDNSWSVPGLKTAIEVHGTLNDPSDRDSGWSVEVAIPWKALAEYAGRPTPPADGDHWRFDFSRVERRPRIADGAYVWPEPAYSENWVWSPPGVINMHCAEKWGYVEFSTARPGTVRFTPDPTEPARMILHDVYYAQRDFHRSHQRYAISLDELGLAVADHESVTGPPIIHATPQGYVATLTLTGDTAAQTLSIRQDSRILSGSP
jgi:hypothetical protein